MQRDEVRRQRSRRRARRPQADPRTVDLAIEGRGGRRSAGRCGQGYAFAADFREERGHAYMLEDQTHTKRQVGGAAARRLHELPRLDLCRQQEGRRRRHHQGLREDQRHAVQRGGQAGEASGRLHRLPRCQDAWRCASPGRLSSRASAPTRPRRASRTTTSTSRPRTEEMRAYVCGQCHVEYYFKGAEKRLVFPWSKGLKVEQIQAYYDEIGFRDWTHKDTGAPALKAQHPEFEMWSQGIACARRRHLRRLPHAEDRATRARRSAITGCAARCSISRTPASAATRSTTPRSPRRSSRIASSRSRTGTGSCARTPWRR